ncbi:MAG: NAD(P)H-hydrate dehydratase [Eggerthellaceae bacterium]|nr:NAD(P)H-hydrate dehydratase [Eggerthellaceae bacterium]
MSFDVSKIRPAADDNKYTRGKLTVVAGSARYPGAAALAARASQRMGAGYTEVVTARKAVDIVRLASPSLVVRPFDEWSPEELPASREGKPCAVCIGPGFAGSDDEAALVVSVLKWAKCPVLVDGGGLAWLTSKKALKFLAKRGEKGLPTVLTPHGGEAARLAKPFSLPTDDPEQLAAGLSLALHAIVVLKGPDTYIADGKHFEVMREGTPALAKAGTGDVLAGMIGALLAQGVEPFEAACAGAELHARAGVAAAARLTDVAVCAEDVIESIPEVLK